MLTSFDQSCIDKDLRHQHHSPTKFFNKEIQISSRLPVLRFIFILAKRKKKMGPSFPLGIVPFYPVQDEHCVEQHGADLQSS